MQYKIIFILMLTMLCISCQPKRSTESIELAKAREVYITNCMSCHGADGQGIQGYYPSLHKPGGIIEVQTERAIRLIKFGSGFESGMKPVSLTNEEVKEVVNYIQNSWGNSAVFISLSQVEVIKR